jgi:hypothetical protein
LGSAAKMGENDDGAGVLCVALDRSDRTMTMAIDLTRWDA